MALVGDGDWPRRPRNQVVLVGRESDEINKGMRESPQPGPRGAAPKLDALLVDRGQVRAERRPLHKALGPVLAVDNILGLVFLVVPEDTNRVTAVHDKLVAASATWVFEERPQVFLFCELLNVRRRVLIINAALPSVPVDVCKFVDAHRMFLIEGNHVKLSDGGCSLTGGGVLDEGESMFGIRDP